MSDLLGHVTSISGSQMTADLEGNVELSSLRIGTTVKVPGTKRHTIGAISAVSVETSPAKRVLVADLVGELVEEGGQTLFLRGVSHYPIPGAPVHKAGDDDLKAIYHKPSVPSLKVGTLYDDPNTPAYVLIEDLLTKHFAVLGTTGTGKTSFWISLSLLNRPGLRRL